MDLYYWMLSTPSLSCLMTAEAAGVRYQKTLVDLRKGDQRTPEYLHINPMSKVPAMLDGEFVLTESLAIQRYIAGKSGSRLYPTNLKDQAVVDRWLNLGASEVRSPILEIEVHRWIAKKMGNPINEGVVAASQARIDRALPVLNRRLENYPFLNGENLTIADISLVSALDPVDVVEIDISDYPSVRDYLESGRNQHWYLAVNTHFGAEFGLPARPERETCHNSNLLHDKPKGRPSMV